MEPKNNTEETPKHKIPRWAKIILTLSFIFYIWYFISTLFLPLASFINIPDGLYLTLYKIIAFPPAIFGFVICISLISTIIVMLEFKEQSGGMKLFLTESISFMLYFIIPIIATILLIILIPLNVSGQIPTEAKISYFLEDIFIFTSALFILSAILNIAIQKIIDVNTKRKGITLKTQTL
jgi:hypothetical protein